MNCEAARAGLLYQIIDVITPDKPANNSRIGKHAKVLLSSILLRPKSLI